jgi:hypothetical protein
MVFRVNSRLIRRLAWVLIAAQIWGAAPVASAMSAFASTSSASSGHCAEMGMDVPGDCACCDDRGMNAAACLSTCLASAGAITTTLQMPRPSSPPVYVAFQPLPHQVELADPPLKPPPIA